MSRSAKRKPVTLDEIEAGLDLIARLMDKFPRQAELMLPIWRALERERDKRGEASYLSAFRAHDLQLRCQIQGDEDGTMGR